MTKGLVLEATDKLSDDEKVYLSEENGNNIELPKKINIQVTEKDIIGKERTIENDIEQILKVKKPDYIADSAWELKFGKSYKNIKIEDSHWINKFLNKEIKLYPGDSIKNGIHCGNLPPPFLAIETSDSSHQGCDLIFLKGGRKQFPFFKLPKNQSHIY